MGKEDGSIFGVMSAGPRGCNGIPERPSCKYPASMTCYIWLQVKIYSHTTLCEQ